MKKSRLLVCILLVTTGIFSLGTQELRKKVPVLNVGTFHMRMTPDKNAVAFNEEDQKVLEETRQLSRLIAKFNPTIICVEIEPNRHEEINRKYRQFLSSSEHDSDLGEVSFIAFEVGKLTGVDSIYGINHLMAYDYMINSKIDNTLDPKMYNAYSNDPLLSAPGVVAKLNQMTTIEKIQSINTPEFMDFLINENADILTHIGTDSKFEGADEAAKFYQRNLRMYSNLNRIQVDEQDRIFILMGGTHTAFFNTFLRRSPKYQLVDVSSYLR
ncbi:hypothetical protein BFP97_15775 [Roseivirga sp. 4D4]|uniref:DUF5694 domain-containing protein n=1 Tax=Roseivirga sp. 4D4 TaxID=1889784 RepID=UPI000853ADB3|nr:DUF5694 domain-containing protein [Roseivirga sp. 4D4]OEK02893.1 hypothetical protein BFP97_15775 [Roseivirga sp. 4D4]